MTNRKDDHIQLALKQATIHNDFDRIKFVPVSLPEVDFKDIDMSIHLFGQKFPLPFFINAMTGGSQQAKTINQRLAQLALAFDLPMATGSMSIALKEASLLETFSVIRDINPKGFLIANLGAGHGLENALKAVDLVKANAFQIHLNAVQEITMPEGDRNFKGWINLIEAIQKNITIPFIVKEVGFGMSQDTMRQLKDIGIQYIDVAGRGGTNFAQIENARNERPKEVFNTWGFSTVESLLSAKKVKGIHVIASGGIRTPLDVIKSLALGAKAVGLSGYFLKLVSEYDHDTSVRILQNFIEECRSMMVALGAPTIESLASKKIILDSELFAISQQL
jgi:isopentenyl-diphosphate Delta-isomerase